MGQTIVEKVIGILQGVDVRADEAYPGGRIPALTGPVAAVRLGKVDRAVRTTAVQVMVMSPADQGGAICDATALRAIQAMEDSGATCQKELCRFDNAADVFYTEITAVFLGVALESGWSPGPGYAIAIGYQDMEWAVGFSIHRQTDDAVTKISDAQWVFTLEELLGPGSIDPPDPAEPFVLTVTRAMTDEVFTGCTWTSVKREDTIRGIRQIRTGVAKTRATSGIL